jgi:hypothetical protein
MTVSERPRMLSVARCAFAGGTIGLLGVGVGLLDPRRRLLVAAVRVDTVLAVVMLLGFSIQRHPRSDAVDTSS